MGWGLFNLIEGVVNHEWLELHHVREAATLHGPSDLAFLAAGAVLVMIGLGLIGHARLRGGKGARDARGA